MTEQMHTPETSPLPFELIEGNEHHGPYIVNAYGATVCDLYAMSNPLSLSVRNGGDSKPIWHANAAGNGALIVAAVNTFASSQERIAQLEARLAEAEKVIEPFASVAEWDIGPEEDDDDRFKPVSAHNYAPPLTVGHLRAARAMLAAAPERIVGAAK